MLEIKEQQMWKEIYLKYLNRYIENGECRGCEAAQASENAHKAVEQYLSMKRAGATVETGETVIGGFIM